MKARIKVNVIVQKLILKCENVIHAEVILQQGFWLIYYVIQKGGQIGSTEKEHR